MKPFQEMTADEIAAHREAWRRGEAEMWRATTARLSRLDPMKRKLIYSDFDAPTGGICARLVSQAVGESQREGLGGHVVQEPAQVFFGRRS